MPFVTISRAAKMLGISRQAMTSAVRAGRIKACCGYCGGGLSLEMLRQERGHKCPVGRFPKYPVVLRSEDVDRFTVDESRQANGRRTKKAMALEGNA